MSVIASPSVLRVSSIRFTDETLRRFGSVLSILAIGSVPIKMAMIVMADALDQGVAHYTFADTLIALCYGTLGLVLVKTQPRNRLVWFFIAVGFCLALVGLVGAGAELIAQSQGVMYEEIETSGWPPGSARILGHIHALWVIANFGLPTFGLLLAPDGRLLSRRWRPVAAVTALLITVVWLLWAAKWPLLGSEAIESYTGWREAVAGSSLLGLLALIVVSLVSLVLRFRRCDAATRHRLRWLLVGGTLFVAVFFAEIFDVGGAGQRNDFLLIIFYPILAIAFGLAIWRDQLFDIDIVISRTLVHASTLVVIAGIYVAVVFGVGTLVGQSGNYSPVLPIVATTVVAVVAHPVRVRLERLANRVVFGRRATPYEVLSDFTQRVAATDDQLLADVAHSVADGTVASEVSVWAMADGMLDPVSVWPDAGTWKATAAVEHTDDELIVPGADETYPIVHHGEVIGVLGLTLPASEALPPGDRELIHELTAGIGLALWNRGLMADLRASVDELRESRRRLVAVQDETRHRLERNLHDGAQQRLVAVKVRLSLARQMAEHARADQTASALTAACDDADEAIESLRDFARGVYPPLLEAEGLAAALKSQLGRSSLLLDLSCEIDGRHGRDVEATVYFTILEAVAAVERSGSTVPVQALVAEVDGRLIFEVGGPTGTRPPLHVMERIVAVGGQVEFDGAGTVLCGWLPIDDAPVVVAAR